MACEAGDKPLIAVIGAGISGLSAAYYLDKNGIDVKVFERENCVGGTMKTVHEKGFLIDTGPNSALDTTPLIGEMIAGAGLADEQTPANPASDNRYILRGGALHALPLHPWRFLRTPLFSARAKARLFMEPFIRPLSGGGGESVAAFVERRLGKEFLDYAINPFIAGVYAGNPRELSVAHAVPRVFQLEQKYGSLIKGAIRGRKERKKEKETSKHTARLFSFRGGMEVFPRGLLTELGEKVMTGVNISSISRSPENAKPFSILYEHNGSFGKLNVDGVYFGIPAYDLAPYVESFSPSTADVLRTIPYARVAMVFIGAEKRQCAHPLDGFGFLVPEIEKRNILGTIWSSSLFPNRAPENKIALTTFAGGARQPELLDYSDDRLIGMVLEDLRGILGFNGSPEVTLVRKWQKAIPQYVMGYEGILKALAAFEVENPGLYIGGNFRHGIAVGDCIKEAHNTAEKITAYFTRR